jgi:hypothetical protein
MVKPLKDCIYDFWFGKIPLKQLFLMFGWFLLFVYLGLPTEYKLWIKDTIVRLFDSL